MLELADVEVMGHHGPLLSGVSVRSVDGGLHQLTVPTRLGRTVCALVATGRMAPDSGQVLFDGGEDVAALRRASALVDSPGLTEPEHHMRVRDLVAETLGLQPRIKGRKSPRAMEWLREYGAEPLAKEHVEALPPGQRLRLLLELAFSDPRVRLAVLDSPDRHELQGTGLADVLIAASGESRSILAITGEASPGLSLGTILRLKRLPPWQATPKLSEERTAV